MSTFIVMAAALVLAVVAALLWPLLRAGRSTAGEERASNLRILREQRAELDAERGAGTLDAAQHADAVAELERRVLDEAGGQGAAARTGASGASVSSRAAALLLALVLPLAAGGLYLALGNPMAFDPVLGKPPSQATAEDIDVLIERLAQRMRQQPEDPAGWHLLGRSYTSMQRFDEARDAFRRALELVPDDPDLLADYADALAVTQGRSLIGEPEQRVLQALAIAPEHLKALALAGSAAMERGVPAEAVAYWTRARDAAPPGSPWVAGLEGSLREARQAAGMAAESVPAALPASIAASAPAAPALSVRVTLAPSLAAQVRPDDTLFVFARAAEGPRLPLAIARLTARDLPATVLLNDTMAMQPQMRLSAFEKVVVGARVSRSGNATPQPGDLEGASAVVASHGRAEVTIDTPRP